MSIEDNISRLSSLLKCEKELLISLGAIVTDERVFEHPRFYKSDLKKLGIELNEGENERFK